MPINRSENEKIHCFKAVGPLSNGKHEFTERVAAFFNVLEQATPVDKNEAFVNQEPDIFENKNLMNEV